MSGWPNFNHNRRNQEEQRGRVANWALLALLGAVLLLILALVFWPSPPPPALEPLTAAKPAAAATHRPAANPQRSASDQPGTTSGLPAGPLAGGPAATSADLSRLAANIQAKTVPTLQVQQPARRPGPQTLAYTVSGSGQSHQYALGSATYGQTKVVGAANEWLVRPWWKPGWLTASADCGEIGVAAVAGHVSWAGRPGPFHDLGALAAGDTIRCQAGSGRWYTYTVDEVVRIDYNETDYYWRPLDESAAELTLFTCTPEITGIIVVRASIHPAAGEADQNEVDS